ncbi:Mobile element protein [hydrothermal vent metagenome]|uniref:Mobile element protein n=1 Tax=hydrothermal vent metagenome TaxID=652676 RepID=A0A3B0YGI2_9ZZZZ
MKYYLCPLGKKSGSLVYSRQQRVQLISTMNKANKKYTIRELCRVLDIKSSSYYYQCQVKWVKPEVMQMITTLKMTAVETNNTYGKRRMAKVLKNSGFQAGLYKTSTLMKQANIVAISPKKKHYYANSGEVHHKASNALNRQFNPGTINTHWVGDITFIRTYCGWSYLACVLDLGSRDIVGWAMSQQPNAELAKEALKQAIQKQQPDTTQLLFHSDQGVQYSANSFIDYLNLFGITQSMSRRGNCWDNSVMERFFRSLKTERLNGLSFMNHAYASSVVDQYIYFYNHKRLHSTIEYLTPSQKRMELLNAA